MLSLQEQWYHLFVLCCFVFNNLAIIETSGTSFFAGCTLYKIGGHLSKVNNSLTIVILVKINIIISVPTLFQTLTNVQKGLIIAVERPSAITPKEATTVNASQALLEMVKTAQVITDSCLLLLFN